MAPTEWRELLTEVHLHQDGVQQSGSNETSHLNALVVGLVLHLLVLTLDPSLPYSEPQSCQLINKADDCTYSTYRSLTLYLGITRVFTLLPCSVIGYYSCISQHSHRNHFKTHQASVSSLEARRRIYLTELF